MLELGQTTGVKGAGFGAFLLVGAILESSEPGFGVLQFAAKHLDLVFLSCIIELYQGLASLDDVAFVH